MRGSPKCKERISKDCYRLLRTAAMAAFKEYADDPAALSRVLDDELGVWSAIFDDVIDSDQNRHKHREIFSPSAHGRPASFKYCILCEDYEVRPGSRALSRAFLDADADLDEPFSFFLACPPSSGGAGRRAPCPVPRAATAMGG